MLYKYLFITNKCPFVTSVTFKTMLNYKPITISHKRYTVHVPKKKYCTIKNPYHKKQCTNEYNPNYINYI